MDYEKKYNAAIEQAKRELKTCGSMDCDAARQIFRFFPELAESEDERIRKFLVEILSHGTWRKEWPFGPNEVVAYLEKQKEQKPAEVDESIKRLNDNWMKKYFDDYQEQKPAEWDANDKAFIKFCARFLDESGYPTSAERLLSMFPIKPAEWSEEDKRMVTGICANLTKYCTQYCNKQSEPSVTQYDFAGKKRKEIKEQCDWLKSLRPSWKPSEEQMEALKEAVKLYKEAHFENFHQRIESLYEQLKAL